ncbi:30S ribosomal protein S17 [Candidatus Woesearchaeota archaeon]|nr:30S ribosomal protein S17 [Candidatus Woesearchaeota archaeon]
MAKEKQNCDDKKCPIHGNVIPRGRTFVGVVVSRNPHKSAVVEWEWKRYNQKYERYERKKTRISVHNPLCLDAQKGDRVSISECRPLSKTKKFVIVKILGKEELFAERERLMEESKVKSPKEIEEEKKMKKKETKEAEE